ncbi:MAG: hypothetical protein U9Q84_08600, partial [Thermodesulfobacteriota bacterium]|nr:hypothetical protein [Thermodesulfobacteriota bacterium]
MQYILDMTILPNEFLFVFRPLNGKQKTFHLCVLCVWFIVVKFYLKKLAENYYVREWATIKLVGAHDNFSAGYKHYIA